jgi:hypothetical protein
MALGILMVPQDGVCALVGSECYISVPDAHHNVTQALRILEKKAFNIATLTGDPLQK